MMTTAGITIVQDRVLTLLRDVRAPLFAVLDAARNAAILPLLRDSRESYQSLYEGEKGQLLADFAPYLVELPKQCDLLTELVLQGWGDCWGVFLSSPKSFLELRKQLRRYLMVKSEQGKRLYFRYYDPRVLRVFLPTCTPGEISDFFGPIHSFLVEDQQPEIVLRFTLGTKGLNRTEIDLSE